ncbi:MAG: Trp biosynthesis-associated membrane protein [Actinomycetota bacterium]
MSVRSRGRVLSVLGLIAGGGVGIISSTQTWLTVIRTDAGEPILVPGADALPLLAPLSLAVLALGAALAIVGPVLRHVLAVLALGAGAFLAWTTLELLLQRPLSAVTPLVVETTGLAGTDVVTAVVDRIDASAWPVLALVGWVLVIATSVFVLVTARGWKKGGRRFRTDTAAASRGDGPVDAIDSWDDLSRGTDPTR